jgi:hypothetical protein
VGLPENANQAALDVRATVHVRGLPARPARKSVLFGKDRASWRTLYEPPKPHRRSLCELAAPLGKTPPAILCLLLKSHKSKF